MNGHEHEIGSLKHRIDDVEKRQNALDKLAESVGHMDAAAIVLTDEQATKAPRLYPTWAAGLSEVLSLAPYH